MVSYVLKLFVLFVSFSYFWRSCEVKVDAFTVPNCRRFWRPRGEVFITFKSNSRNDRIASKTNKNLRKNVDNTMNSNVNAKVNKENCNIGLQPSSSAGKRLLTSENIVSPNASTLQACVTPREVLEIVGQHICTSTDPTLSSLVLVRLSKQLISLDNDYNYSNNPKQYSPVQKFGTIDDIYTLQLVVMHFSQKVTATFDSFDEGEADKKIIEAIVQGTKSMSTIARILYKWIDKNDLLMNEVNDLVFPIVYAWYHAMDKIEDKSQAFLLWNTLQPQHVTGIKWAFDTFKYAISLSSSMHESSIKEIRFPTILEEMYRKLDIPFCIYPGLMLSSSKGKYDNKMLTVSKLQAEVEFGVDEIVATTKSDASSGRVVSERRLTAWQGDDQVAGFAYSGKVMPRFEWSPTVLSSRTHLHVLMNQYYDCCLLNLYHQSTSGMRYHIDPDQGKLWDFDTSVVSVGATRRFAFRELAAVDNNNSNHVSYSVSSESNQPHTFVVMDGDVTHMYDRCQQRYQHTVKKAENKLENAMRASLVFKRSLR